MNIQIENPYLKFFFPLIAKVTRVDKFIRIYDKYASLEGLEFADKILEHFNIKIDYDEEALLNFPEDESFFCVSNHPYGLLDGLIFIKLLSRRNVKFKIVVNHVLGLLEPLNEYFTFVDPFPNAKMSSRISGIRAINRDLEAGHSLVFFPAGDVSYFQFKTGKVCDKEWSSTSMKIIKRANLPVIPVKIEGANSFLYQFLNLIHPKLALAKLPSELMNKEGRTIRVEIGQPIALTTGDVEKNKLRLREAVEKL